jgi:putative acyl-CoA dehydrogenase
MASPDPIRELGTHTVFNQPAALAPIELYAWDAPLREALEREGAGWGAPQLERWSARLGSEESLALAEAANRHSPQLRAFDRGGQRIDEIEYHPAYHALLGRAIEHELHSVAWTSKLRGGHVLHGALTYLQAQIETGVCCPLTMTYAALPVLRVQPELAREWEPRVLSTRYDPRCIPAEQKLGATFGMAMTEKQGGSDVRANRTQARAVGAPGPGAEYRLTGHKWFCSAPMSDGFFTLAQSEGERLSCFLVPRWTPDGRRNRFFLQRLKDKLGNRSNASAELEYSDSFAQLVGEEGRGVATILDMVHHTRLNTALAAAGLMRQALLQAGHYAAQRSAFGRPLLEQPLMRAVLADLALESEAALALALRVARSFDDAQAGDARAQAFGRLATALAKYWLNRRAPAHVAEALECLGGAGYVEESVLPRLYREAPLGGIWEGSGNVICLDVLRTLAREPAALEVLLREVGLARGGDARLDRAARQLEREFAAAAPGELEPRARWLAQRMAQLLQGALLVRFAPPAVADLFCASRLGEERGCAYGVLPSGAPLAAVLERALPGLG